MKKLWVLAVVLMVLSMSVAIAKESHDSDSAENEDREDRAPDHSALVLNIKHKVTNDEDSGNVGYWALDNYNKQVQVWQVSDGTFYAVARYAGDWQTFAGAKSPGAGTVQGNDASGTFQG